MLKFTCCDAQAQFSGRVQAQVLQVTAERNRVVSGYQLLAAIGHLTAGEIGLKVPIYDPDANYKRVRNKWIGTDVKTVE